MEEFIKVKHFPTQGLWFEDKIYGLGLMIYPNGDTYKGRFDDFIRSGHGVYTYSNGEKYEGFWYEDKKHGEGALTNAEGKRTHGYWNNDTMEREMVVSGDEDE